MNENDNEFGFADFQIRADMFVKNATVFEVSGNAIQEILTHGDLNEQDLQKMANTGRTFFVLPEMGERHGDQGWKDFWTENVQFSRRLWHFVKPSCPAVEMPFMMTANQIAEFRDFARVIVENFTWTPEFRFRRWA